MYFAFVSDFKTFAQDMLSHDIKMTFSAKWVCGYLIRTLVVKITWQMIILQQYVIARNWLRYKLHKLKARWKDEHIDFNESISKQQFFKKYKRSLCLWYTYRTMFLYIFSYVIPILIPTFRIWVMSKKLGELGAVHMRWAGPVKWAGSPKWGDFYPTFICNLSFHFNQKVCYVAGKRLFWPRSF